MSSPVCPKCKAERPVHDGPGVAVQMPGMLHKSTCPTLPQPTAAERAEYQAWLDEYHRCQREAWHYARNAIVG